MSEPTTRRYCLDTAAHALREAVLHAKRAGTAAYGRPHETQAHAAAGALWASVARTATALAATLPDTTTEA
ncbi:hypothetical protein PV396_41910 [Streptomyces sp. ME02-8801-2C]|uniref:hypothetical protein n=1 Tax=Streptomyces sp. ME02-8801-2C TaxID=3028680 RepID=UPI0029B75DC6|nr:hypothetical protein [Streptomyces sp. ME02-8801-2C]MDX3458421.1 hypothetical protein [Streptomyces sp. ME02-8801-2C]